MSIAGRAGFDLIRYSNCWEDPDVMIQGLEVRPGGDYLSITSAGDNALAMLVNDPGRVVAVDLSPDQTALAMLKGGSFRALSHGEMLRFLGFEPETPAMRAEMYRAVGDLLPEEVHHYWNSRPDAIARGVIHIGRFERYFHTFRRWVLPLIHSHRTVEQLLLPRDRAGREQFYSEVWDTPRWRGMFMVFFSRTVMGRLGRDPEFFRHVQGSVARRILDRTRAALTELPVSDNPWIRYILTGSFGNTLPEYARPEHFAVVARNIGALEYRTGDITDAIAGGHRFDGMNLSDIFEYMPLSEAAELGGRLADRLRPGGRMVYWEMLAERNMAELLPGRFVRLDELSDGLHRQDRAFFYQRMHVVQKTGPEGPADEG